MLQLIIDAFEEKNKDENFFKSLKKMDILNRIFVVVIILVTILSYILFLIKKYKWSLYTIAGMVIVLYILIYILSVRSRKKWKDNIKNYNKKLDKLKDILSEENINYYSENKIKYLIDQCDKSINDRISVNEKKKEKRHRFIEKYILPIVAFGAGVMSDKIDISELIQICIMAIIIIIIINIYIWLIDIFIEEITGTELEKKKSLKCKLEDLLIRDFCDTRISKS